MDLVEDFDRVRNFVDLGAQAERYGADAADEGARLKDVGAPSTSYDLPSLTLELSLRQAARYACCVAGFA
jgi:hypothetical protein